MDKLHCRQKPDIGTVYAYYSMSSQQDGDTVTVTLLTIYTIPNPP